MSITAPSGVQTTRTEQAWLPVVQPRRVQVHPGRVLRLRRVADGQARHVGRRLPQGAPARRRVAVLLRHRQLRRRRRDGQPLRHRGPVRRPLQRRRIARPSSTTWRTSRRSLIKATFEEMLDDWTNDGFDPFAVADRDRLRLRRQARRQPGGHHPPSGDGGADGQRARRRAAPHRRQRPPGQPPVPRRAAGRAREVPGARASRARSVRSTCSPTCRARRSPGTRRSCRSAATACTARRPRSTSCRSSTATTASSGSSSCRTSSSGRSRTATPGPRGPRSRCVPATWRPCPPTSATRATPRSARCCSSGRTPIRSCPALISSGQLPSVPVEI